MNHSKLKQIIKEEVRTALFEDDSNKVSQLKKEIEGAFRAVAMPSFEKNTVATKEPALKTIISDIEQILEKYK